MMNDRRNLSNLHSRTTACQGSSGLPSDSKLRILAPINQNIPHPKANEFESHASLVPKGEIYSTPATKSHRSHVVWSARPISILDTIFPTPRTLEKEVPAIDVTPEAIEKRQATSVTVATIQDIFKDLF